MPGRRIERTTATSTTARTSTVMTTASPDLTGEKSVSAVAAAEAGQRSSQDEEMPRAAGELRLSECQVKQLVIKSLKCRFL